LNLTRVNSNRYHISMRIILLFICVIIFAVNVYSHFRYTPDDTYIYLQYAKNLTQGNGIAFNAGEPTYGITSPIWLFIISAGGIAGIDIYLWAKIIDVILACTALIIFYNALYPLVEDFAIRFCATVVFSLNVWFLRWTGTGMETSLAVLLFLVSLGFLLRRKYIYASVFTGLLVLVRPEGLLFYLIILASMIQTEKKNRKRLIGTSVILFALPVIPWLIYAFHTFGTVMPNTALAKAGLSDSIRGRLSTLWDMTETATVSDGLSIFICVVACGLLLYNYKYWKNNRSEEDPIRLSFLILIGIGWMIILPVFYALSDINFISRYFLILTPMILMFAYYFLKEVVLRYLKTSYLYPVILAFTALVMVQNQIVYVSYVRPGIDAFTEGMNLSLIPIGKWLSINTPKESRVFAEDVGAIGYYSNRYVCDAAGLISPSLLKLQRLGYTHKRMIEEKVYTTIYRADYVVFRTLASDELIKKEDLVPRMTLPFPQMGISDRNAYYYTVYSVRSPENKSNKGKGEHE
jgi:arabinofuranosyltransferase